MTYNEFKAGLFMKYHFTYLKSTPFIKFVYRSDTSATFEDGIILKVDSERVLKKIKSKNIVEALCLMAQGYMEWEVAEKMGKSEEAIKQYIYRTRKLLEKI
jgi:DNA-binding NarL/FixJ family response regulator